LLILEHKVEHKVNDHIRYFTQTAHSTFEGRALAIVTAGYQAGMITVKVSADGFESREVEIYCEINVI